MAAFQNGREGSKEREETGGAGVLGCMGGTRAWSQGLNPIDSHACVWRIRTRGKDHKTST